MTLLLLLPAVLGCWLMGAHVLRVGMDVVAAALAALPLLLLVRRSWVPVVFQLVLLLAAAEWLRTVVGLVRGRLAAGEPWLRMAVILTAVLLVTLGAAAALRYPRIRQRYAGP